MATPLTSTRPSSISDCMCVRLTIGKLRGEEAVQALAGVFCGDDEFVMTDDRRRVEIVVGGRIIVHARASLVLRRSNRRSGADRCSKSTLTARPQSPSCGARPCSSGGSALAAGRATRGMRRSESCNSSSFASVKRVVKHHGAAGIAAEKFDDAALERHRASSRRRKSGRQSAAACPATSENRKFRNSGRRFVKLRGMQRAHPAACRRVARPIRFLNVTPHGTVVGLP